MSRIYIGNLPDDIRRSELEDLFYKYGSIIDITIKNSNSRYTYAFVEYKHREDAKDAVYYRNDYKFDGARLIVEMAKPFRDRNTSVPNRKSKFRIIINNLPRDTKWQELKDYLKPYNPGYTDVINNIGYCEFKAQEDLQQCKDACDNKEYAFKNGTITVSITDDTDLSFEYNNNKYQSRDDRSPSRHHYSHHHHHHHHHHHSSSPSSSRSPSRSPSRSHSRSHSHHSHSHTPSRSRSRSVSHYDHSKSASHSPERSPSHSVSNDHHSTSVKEVEQMPINDTQSPRSEEHHDE